MEVAQFVLESDNDDLDIVATSAPMELKQPVEGKAHRDSNWGVIPIHIYAASGVTGSIQGVLAVKATEAADIHDSTGLWKDIDGGDLSNWASGGCTALFAPFTHIRFNVTAGTLRARAWK